MARSRSFVALAGAGILGLALVGVGASAQFTDSVSASQTITTGTLDVNISSDTGGVVSNQGRAVTLAAAGPFGSTFTAGKNVITIQNDGNIPATAVTVKFSAVTKSAGGPALLAGTKVTLTYGTLTTTVPFSELIAGSPYVVSDIFKGVPATLAPKKNVQFAMEFSAADLPFEAEGGVVIPKITVDGKG